MRHLALLLCASLAWSESLADVRTFLAGENPSYPGLGDPALRAEVLPLIAGALRGPIEIRERAWGLLGNLGPEALPIRDEILASFQAIPVAERGYAVARGLASLGPLAEPLLPAILAAPDRLGLDWVQIQNICRDPAVLVPRLLAEAAGPDPVMASLAAEGLRQLAWCPAMESSVPELERLLARWPAAPPIGPKRRFVAISWMSEPGDPDDAELFARRETHDTPPDPWPSLLLALAGAAPASPAARQAALAQLRPEADAARRQAALQALALLEPGDRAALAAAMVPWLGPGPRGRHALTVLFRLGDPGMRVLSGLPDATRDRIIPLHEWHIFDRVRRLPESWAAPLVNALGDRPCIAYTEIIAACGTAGAEHLLAMPEVDTARFAISADLLPPEREPAGLEASLADPVRQRLAQAMLEAWWQAPWARALASRRRGEEAIDLRLAALAAADGDATAAAWLRADPGRIRALAHDPPWQLRLHPELLPADLAAALPGALHPSPPQPDLNGLPTNPDLAEAFLLGRLRRNGDSAIALHLLSRGIHADEAAYVLSRSPFMWSARHVAELMALPGTRLLPTDRARWLEHHDPLVRRMAAGW